MHWNSVRCEKEWENRKTFSGRSWDKKTFLRICIYLRWSSYQTICFKKVIMFSQHWKNGCLHLLNISLCIHILVSSRKYFCYIDIHKYLWICKVQPLNKDKNIDIRIKYAAFKCLDSFSEWEYLLVCYGSVLYINGKFTMARKGILNKQAFFFATQQMFVNIDVNSF